MTVVPEHVINDRVAASARLFATVCNDPEASTAMLRRMIEAADIFVGVLPDGGIWIVKGDALLERIAKGMHGPMAKASIDAVSVRCAEEAEAMRLVFGDGADVVRSSSDHRLQVIEGDRL